jgi:hypothetical protein
VHLIVCPRRFRIAPKIFRLQRLAVCTASAHLWSRPAGMPAFLLAGGRRRRADVRGQLDADRCSFALG